MWKANMNIIVWLGFKHIYYNIAVQYVSQYVTGTSPSLHLYVYVEKGKISYFGLARNLIRHLISSNQDDISYSARTFISG